MIVPAKLRGHLGDAVYVTVSIDDGYLTMYTEPKFRDIHSQIAQLPSTNPAVRRLMRDIVGEALLCELDSQGRISVSEALWQQINVAAGDEICFIDMFDKVEICSKQFFEAKEADKIPLSELDLSEFDVKGL